ncbi:MAG: sphingomyelin phosphodiesterase [Bacteroidales bacterium]|nr:sphingomyelin phosphodiesterase [Bacteroidales bacterium]
MYKKYIVFMVLFFLPLAAQNKYIYASRDHFAGNELKILSWNIYMLPSIITQTNNSDRAKAIGEYLGKGEFDVILFQEAFSAESRRIIFSLVQDTYPYEYGPANSGGISLRLNSGLWILSKMPLRKIDEIEFKQSRGFDAFARKGAILMEGILNNFRFQILNTHLNAGDYDELRASQYRQIRNDLLDKYRTEDVVQIVCGDFNVDKNDGHNFKRLINDLAVRDYYAGWQCSYDGESNDLVSPKYKKRSLIDYIFLRNNNSDNIHVVSNVHRLKRNWSEHHYDLSDHYPVSATVTLQTESRPVFAESVAGMPN